MEDTGLVETPNKQKYCIVSGVAGYNDFFNTFFKACEKVEYGRKLGTNIGLVIHWMGMSDEFWDFFEPTEKISKITNANSILVNISNLKSFMKPQYLYYKHHIGMRNKFINPEEIDWNDSSWDFLVEYFPGQWNYAHLFFEYLRLSQYLKSHIRNLIDILDNGNYICLNFRMQEYIKVMYKNQSEEFYHKKILQYSDIIEKTSSTTDSKILLCTDDVHLVAKFVDNKKIFSFGYAKSLIDRKIDLNSIDKNQGIHIDYHNHIGLSKRDICLASFTDYLLMSLSKKLFPAEFGHFGRAAYNLHRFLHENKQIKQHII